jgi:hypothetical protein
VSCSRSPAEAGRTLDLPLAAACWGRAVGALLSCVDAALSAQVLRSDGTAATFVHVP